MAALAAAAAVAVGLVGLPSVPAAAAAVNEQYPVRADGTIGLEGAGFGHGVGLSQYGAKVGAEQGNTAHQILAAYYPGTVLASAPTRSVRVLLQRWDGASACTSALPASTCLEVLTEPGQVVRNTASGAQIAIPSTINGYSVTAVAVQPTAAGVTIWALAGTWNQLSGTFTGPIEISSPDGVQQVRIAGTDRPYRGLIRVVRASATTVNRVNVLPMEDYLLSVVPSEMPDSWSTAAVQAQAVAARTYAAAQMSASGTRAWDLCDTTSCQVYGGVNAERAASTSKIMSAAPSDVRGKVLSTSSGMINNTFFSSSNGGYSVSGGVPWLPARADSWDPRNPWTRTVSGSCLASKYPGRGAFTRLVVTERDGNGSYGGRVTSLRLDFAAGSVTIGPGTTPMGTDTLVRGSMSGCGDTGGLRSSLFRGVNPTTPPPPPTSADVLQSGSTIASGGVLSTPTGQFQAKVDPVVNGVMQPGLTLTSRTCPAVRLVPSSGTNRLMMQTDGNLVLYSGSAAVWSTGTYGKPGAYAVLSYGNLEVRARDGAVVWASNTTCSQMAAFELPARYAATGTPQPSVMQVGDGIVSADRTSGLYLQKDGNLVYYRGGVARWSSATNGKPVQRAVMQSDGNLVVYPASGPALFATATVWPALPAGQVDETYLRVEANRLVMTRVVRTTAGATVSSSTPWIVS